MIYGTPSIRKELIETALDYADKNNLLLVYGATIGSISRGINLPDSDYDARFLFLDKATLGHIFIPSENPENLLHFKFNPQSGRNRQNSVLDDCLPFWEATSFFQFLKHPSYTEEISLGLYNTFAWTMFSPYTWDPYGLQMKLMPFFNSVFNATWLFEWHKKILEKYLASDKTSFSWKDYLKAIHAALSLNYIKTRNEFPPIYLPDLAFAHSFEFGEKCLSLINEAYIDFLSSVNKIEEIDAFLESSQLMEIPDSVVSSAKVDSVLKNVYKILFSSVNNYKRDLVQVSC